MVFFAAVLRIAANYYFHSSNFFRGHVLMEIGWRDFTGANPSKLTSLLTFVCILQYISFNLHQFSLHIFQCDCRWCIIFLFSINFSSTSLPGGSWSVSDFAFGKVQVSSSDKKGFFLTGRRHTFVTYASDHRTVIQSLLSTL